MAQQQKPIGVPPYLTKRFGSLHSYVWGKLYTESYLRSNLFNIHNKQDHRKKVKELQAIVSEASLVLFIFFVHRFFVEGTSSAEKAVEVFSDLGIESFFIGTKEFSEGNEAVEEGRRLANKLLETITDRPLRKLIKSSEYASDIFAHYKRSLPDRRKFEDEEGEEILI